jgi:hypothetical protein
VHIYCRARALAAHLGIFMMPQTIVIDRHAATNNALAVDERLMTLGGAWREMFNLWKTQDSPYLILMADTDERLRKRAPLTFFIGTDEMLRTIVARCCTQLAGVQCRWVLFVDESVEQLVRQQLLADAVVEGNA